MSTSTTVTLASSPLIHTPGMVEYIRRVWLTQPALALDMLGAWDMPLWAAIQLLADVGCTVDGDRLTVTRQDEPHVTAPQTDSEKKASKKRRW